MKGSMSGGARDFNNIETRAVIKFFFFFSKGWSLQLVSFLVGLRTYQPFLVRAILDFSTSNIKGISVEVIRHLLLAIISKRQTVGRVTNSPCAMKCAE
jgi:hypothetical protein